MARLFLSLVAVSVVVLGGCATEVPKAEVRGTVTLDQKPLKEGKILFSSPGKPPEALDITNGTFQGKVAVGERKVEFVSYTEVEEFRMPGEPPTGKAKGNILPPQYNTESAMRVVVKEGAPEFKFNLKSNP